jgi:hypothetical protein
MPCWDADLIDKSKSKQPNYISQSESGRLRETDRARRKMIRRRGSARKLHAGIRDELRQNPAELRSCKQNNISFYMSI